MKIIVHDNPNTGNCPVISHFRENWIENDGIHPAIKAIEVVKNDKAYGDSITFVDQNKAQVTQAGQEALRLDLFQESILAYLIKIKKIKDPKRL